MTALEAVFWVCAGLIVWTQVGYAASLAVLVRLGAGAHTQPIAAPEPPPSLSLIVAAHDEQSVIAARVANALALDYPRELMEVIVTCDGCTDATAARAHEAGADVVLELERGGKIRAQDAAVQRARGDVVAFSDANALWEPDAARMLVGAFADPRVGYACGQVRFVQAAAGADAGNQEGVYWRYELAVRAYESRLSSITAGNGAIYATRRDAYIVVDPIMGHDLSLPFNMVRRGLRAVYVPTARASEKMVPSLLGEFARKRRMMSHTWPILVRGGMLFPRGYPPGYALMIVSHRLLRYLTPFLHLLALVANIALVARDAGALYEVTLALQLALLLGALLGGVLRVRPLLIARYYVLTTASPAAGLWDWLRHGTSPILGSCRGHKMIRRTLDIAVSGLGLALGAPVLAAAMVAIRLESRGAVIYRQRRVGMHGREFDVLKLRTMVDGAEHIGAGLAIDANDSRVTRVGALLRRASLDELPNLLNVLRGDMSLIGPRPTLPVQVAQYTERQRGRLQIRPGITGWAQVNGRASLPWSERIELDLYYIAHRSLLLDLRILWRTPALVLGGDGLYKGPAGGWEHEL